MTENNSIESILNEIGKSVIIEGVNAVDWVRAVENKSGLYLRVLNIPDGNRCFKLLDSDYWRGHNGSEDITAEMKDCLFFDKRDLIKAIELALKNPTEEAIVHGVGERVRSDGFWEDGIPNFNLEHLKEVPIQIMILVSAEIKFEISYQSDINPHWVWNRVPNWFPD